MALEQSAFDLLIGLAPCRLLSLGVPDLLLTEEYDVKRVDNEERLQRWHSWHSPIYDTAAMFHEFGIEATYSDNQQHRGNEEAFDLNRHYDDDLYPSWASPRFDVVLDPGTLEHCFNIGQAFKNVRSLCRPGGHILHINPLSMFNHGFWNLNPCAYDEFYTDHGDELVSAKIIGGPLEDRHVYRWKRWERFGAENSMICQVLVKRGDKPTSSGWSAQVKYDDAKRKAAVAFMKAERAKMEAGQ